MGLERRSRADQGQPGANPSGEEPGARPEPKVKSSVIGKRLIVEAWEKVRADNGAPGVDAAGIGLFAEQLRDNRYKLWNRMSSGELLPGAGAGVEILEPVFHRDSYGYRPGRSAHDAHCRYARPVN
jgi:RNA-directed DNA polymerase